MIVSVMLAGFLGMMRSVHGMPVRYVGVVTRCFVVPGLMMVGGCAMMLRGVLVMFCCFLMVFRALFRHL